MRPTTIHRRRIPNNAGDSILRTPPVQPKRDIAGATHSMTRPAWHCAPRLEGRPPISETTHAWPFIATKEKYCEARQLRGPTSLIPCTQIGGPTIQLLKSSIAGPPIAPKLEGRPSIADTQPVRVILMQNATSKQRGVAETTQCRSRPTWHRPPIAENTHGEPTSAA